MHLFSDSINTRKVILIVDDSRQMIQLIGSMLEKEGYAVLMATSGPKALEIARTAPLPDLILLDILMPAMGGFALCRQLKSDPLTCSIPVIFISGVENVAMKVEAFHSGAVDYITKPFQSEEVVARVRCHLQLSAIDELRREIAERIETEEALKQSQAKLAVLAAERGLTEERERRRITLALQDQVVQKLALGKLKLDQALIDGEIPWGSVVSELQGILDGSLRDLNELSANLSPGLLYEAGLKPALEGLGKELARQHGFIFAVSGDETGSLGVDLRVTLFQITRELLINVVKHADASQAHVFIARDEASIWLEVVDDGVGLDPSSFTEGFGLAYIRQRVKFLGGAFKILTAPGKGTRIIVRMPVDACDQPH